MATINFVILTCIIFRLSDLGEFEDRSNP